MLLIAESGSPSAKAKPITSSNDAAKWGTQLQTVIENNGVDIDDAVRFLTELKHKSSSPEIAQKNPETTTHENAPSQLKCPISKKLMSDPVILASGVTYDRRSIQRWIDEGNWKCPQTSRVLTRDILIPNLWAYERVLQWCKEHKVPLNNPLISDVERSHLVSLLGNMSSSFPHQQVAAKEIRLLTKKYPSFQWFFGESKAFITQLLKPLSRCSLDDHPNVQEDLVTTIFNISLPYDNRQFVAEHPLVVPLLIKYLESGTIETRRNAAAALSSLSRIESNKHLIGDSGAIKPLIELLNEGNHEMAVRDAVGAMFNLCLASENRGRAVREGAVNVVLERFFEHDSLLDELLALLSFLTYTASKRAAREMARDIGFVQCLLGIIRETTSDSDDNKENCVVILREMCLADEKIWKAIWRDEATYQSLLKLNNKGTPRAKKASSVILKVLIEKYSTSRNEEDL